MSGPTRLAVVKRGVVVEVVDDTDEGDVHRSRVCHLSRQRNAHVGEFVLIDAESFSRLEKIGVVEAA